MNNALIQRVLAGASSDAGPVTELLRELIAPGGAVEIADEAAWEVIRSECPARVEKEVDGEFDPDPWYRIHHNQLELDLNNEEERIVAAQIMRAVTYLAKRELLCPHPEEATLVRLSPDARAVGAMS